MGVKIAVWHVKSSLSIYRSYFLYDGLSNGIVNIISRSRS